MKLINNRYKLIKRLQQNKLVTSYLAADIWNDYKKLQLNVLNSEFIPQSLIEYVSNEYIVLINLTSQHIVKNYSFNSISHHDNKKVVEERYFYTCEYIEHSKGLLDYIQMIEPQQIINVFIEICSAVYYLHLKGLVYGAINPNNVMVVHVNGRNKIMFKDLATVKIDGLLHIEDAIYTSPKVLSSGNPNFESDIYSLGVLLLSMFKGQPLLSNPKDELYDLFAELADYSDERSALLTKLLPILEKLLGIHISSVYKNLYDFIIDLNDHLNSSFSIVSRSAIEKLAIHTKLVGREEETKTILEQYNNLVSYHPGRRIFLVKGDTGSGKTRFLKEMSFLLGLKKANIYSSFSLRTAKDANNKMWTDLLQKIILETNHEIIEKYESELAKYFPEINRQKNNNLIEFQNESHSKYRLLNRIAGFISESIKNKPTVLIIDDIHHADDLTIDTITYLCSEVINNNNNLMMIFSYNDSDGNQNTIFSEFIKNVRIRKDSETIYMNSLDIDQSGEMIRMILTMPYRPMNLARRIFPQTYGNPLFISETIKDLYSRKIIYVHPDSGVWSIDMPDTDGYKRLVIPNSIEQALLNQIEQPDSKSYNILEAGSIFTKPISIKYLKQLTKISTDELDRLLQTLVEKGIMRRLFDDNGYVYDFNNKVLKSIVYDRMNVFERATSHKKAAEFLENEVNFSTATNLDDLIFHYEKAGNKEKTKVLYQENANKMRAIKNFRVEIYNLEKALSLIESDEERIELLIKIGILYSDTTDVQLSLAFFIDAEKIAIALNMQKNLIDIYVNMAQVYSLLYDDENTKKYINNALLELETFEYLEADLECRRIQALMLIQGNLLVEAEKKLLTIIEECGDRYHKVKGNAYRHLGYLNSHLNKIEEALEFYQKAIRSLERADYPRGILLALNNIGGLYSDHFEDMDTAMSYYIKVRDLSAEYGIHSSEIYGLINIAAIHHDTYHLAKAYELYKHALTKIKRANVEQLVFFSYNSLTNLSLKMSNFSNAIHFYNLLKNEIDGRPNKGLDIVDFYKTNAELHKTFGDFKESEKYYKMIINFHKERENVNKYISQVEVLIAGLRNKEMGTYDSDIHDILLLSERIPPKDIIITTLSHTAIVLSDKGDCTNAKQILSVAKKYISDTTPSQLKAHYFYAKGAAEQDEQGRVTLLTALEVAKDANNKELISRISMKLGESLFKAGDYYNSTTFFLESCEILKHLISQIPDDFKLSYINSYNLASGFYRLKQIKEILIGKGEMIPNRAIPNFEVRTLEELSMLISSDDASDFANNVDYMHYISTQYMINLSKDINTEKDIFMHITSNVVENIETVLRFLAARLLATKGLIVIAGLRQNFEVISSIDDHHSLPANLFIFDRVKSSMKPTLLTEKLNKIELEQTFLTEDIKACLCIPITLSSGKNRLLGYLYLESDRLVNRFNNEGLQKCLDFNNYLALLMEKHQLKLSASIDKLTGALTRKYLEDELKSVLEITSKSKDKFSIIMYDLDRFKSVNDQFGHQTGDQVLEKVSKLVMDTINRNEILGRYGGEEFIIILPNTDSNQALTTAEDIRTRIQNNRFLGNQFEVTVSMGVASYPDDGQTVQELIERADQALYVAKESGRNNSQRWISDFNNKIKPVNKLSGIISGNEIKDSRNILALVELIQLTNKNMRIEEKIYHFLGRLIEVAEAQVVYFIRLNNKEIINYFGRRFQEHSWIDHMHINQTMIETVIENKQGLFGIDWDDIDRINPVNRLPDWNSVLVVPIIVQDEVKGIFYLSTPTRVKEFGPGELYIIKVFSDLAAHIMS